MSFKVGDKVKLTDSSYAVYSHVWGGIPRDGVVVGIISSSSNLYVTELGPFSLNLEDYEIELVEEKKEESVGIKFDNGKPDLTDIPLEAMWQMGAAFTYGQKKYGKSNFRNGMLVSRQLAAAVRHIYQHLDGETVDPETGVTTHLGHAMASIAMAIYNLKHNTSFDDRFEKDLERHKK